MTDFPTLSILRFAANNHQPLFQGSQREPWERGYRKIWVVYLWFNYVIFRVFSYTFRKDSSGTKQLPRQSCCVEVISLGDFSLRPWAGVRQAGLFCYFFFRQFLLSKVSKYAKEKKNSTRTSRNCSDNRHWPAFFFNDWYIYIVFSLTKCHYYTYNQFKLRAYGKASNLVNAGGYSVTFDNLGNFLDKQRELFWLSLYGNKTWFASINCDNVCYRLEQANIRTSNLVLNLIFPIWRLPVLLSSLSDRDDADDAFASIVHKLIVWFIDHEVI